METPAVTVIIPAYNCADLIGQAVESVKRQSCTDFEVIAVDDGSTDRTWKTLQALADGWPKLKAMQIEHAGLAAARNAAIREMKGTWIALLDSDDLWLDDKLERCMSYLGEHPDLSIVYSPMDAVRMDGTVMQGHSKPCHAGRLTEKLFHSIFVHDPAAVIHKRVIETSGGFDESLPVCVGHEFWLRVSLDFEFGLIDEPLALRRWSEQSLTRTRRSQGRQIKARMLEKFYFELGGKDIIDTGAAMKRLAKVHYSAGKALLSDGELPLARQFFRKAIGYQPGKLKVYPFYVAALAGALVGK